MSLYNTKQWKRLRLEQLRLQPWCTFCLQLNIRTPATVVDHITPHKGDRSLFFDPSNFQSLCKPCHDSAKKRLELSGTLKGGNVLGIPFDVNHHWHQ